MKDRKSFISALAANGASELAQKLSRIGVVVAVSRSMDAEAIGLAAAAIAAGDILKALTENGVVQRIIAATDEQVEDVAAKAWRLFWLWCVGLAMVQLALAGLVWMWTGSVVVAGLIAVMSLEYLFMPGGIVQCALAMRAGKLNSTAYIAGGQIVAANFLSAALAIVWPVPLSLVLPRILTAPVWLFGMRRLHPWKPSPTARPVPLRPFLTFGGCVLGSEVVRTLRLQADKLLIGALLGAEALGAYFFAFNAGLGLATSASAAFARVMFPRIAVAENRHHATGEAMRIALLATVPVVLLQAALAPYYVPILFGEKWAYISNIVSILCLAAIPTIIWSGTAQWYRAENRAGYELVITALMTVLLLASTAILAPMGLEAIAWGYLVVVSAVQLAASMPVLRMTFRKMEA